MKRTGKILLYLFLLFLLSLTQLDGMLSISENNLEKHQWLWIMIDSAMFLLVMGVAGAIYWKIRKPQSPSKQSSQKIMITVGLFLVAVAIDYLYSAWCESTGNLPGNQEAINANLTKLPILTMLQVRLFGPISEELIFRGIFMNLFFQKKRNGINFVVSFLPVSFLVWGTSCIYQLRYLFIAVWAGF